jgi:23S rRNA (adenine2030-N6)-methyltransferase
MNYRHAFHAGNFADVVKHLALVSILLHLRRKEKPFAVIDTHGGRGRYDLSGEAAVRTGEAQEGIERLRPLGTSAELPEALRAYLELASADGPASYPGSPLIAARLLRPQDRLVAIEKHPDEAGALASVLAPFRKARAIEGDGYARLGALLPLPERRGLVLIDPPYEAPDEFRTAAAALAGSWRRFATGIYMLWFPIKSAAAADAFCGEALAAGIDKALRIDIARQVPAGEGKERMRAAGLLIVNPPYGLDVDVGAAAALLEPALGAKIELRQLAGEGGL